jgi:hypothetical protein
MSPKKFSIIGISSLFVLFALSATACSSLPNIASATQPTAAPTIVSPIVAPTTASMPDATPSPAPAAQDPAPKNARPLVLAAVLKATGLQGGVVRANNAGTLSVQIRKDAQQVQTNADTLVVVPGARSAKISDLRVNDRVLVQFPNGDATQPASFVMVVPSDLTIENVLLAAVQSNKPSGLTVRTPQGSEVLTTDAATTVVNLSSSQPTVGSLADLKLGNAIVAIGSGYDSGFSAQTIIVVEKDARKLLKQARPNPPAAQPTPNP